MPNSSVRLCLSCTEFVQNVMPQISLERVNSQKERWLKQISQKRTVVKTKQFSLVQWLLKKVRWLKQNSFP